ncbi:metallophosphoesterase family protein [Minwuia sp.]|uniref:metallophosphoesterase family protein n=1 Tax=Minwuia sp. TaxID=2493630 RepID=UPI003A93193D
MRIAQISDTHLSDRHGFFVENFLRVTDAINAWQPDLVIHTGDLTINGAERGQDIGYAMDAMRQINAPVLVLPGNHDVGEEPGFMQLDQPTTAESLARYRSIAGDDRWAIDAGAWRLIGINAQLLGTGLAAERSQALWFQEELDAATSRQIGVFLHKPLFFPRNLKGRTPGSIFVPAGVRARMFSQLLRAGVRFVSSGHLHKYLDISVAGVRWIWAPATAYRSGLNIGVGRPSLGFLKIELEDSDFSIDLVEPDGMVRQKLSSLKGGERFLKDAPPQPSASLPAD